MKDYEFDDFNFHDAEILQIKCDYEQEIVSVYLYILDEKRKFALQIKNFILLNVTNYNPWGDGIYIFDIHQEILGNHLRIDVLINSGDHLIVEGDSLVITELTDD